MSQSTCIAQWSQSVGLKGNPSTLASSPSTGRSSVVFGEKNPPVSSSCFPNTVLVWLYLKAGVKKKSNVLSIHLGCFVFFKGCHVPFLNWTHGAVVQDPLVPPQATTMLSTQSIVCPSTGIGKGSSLHCSLSPIFWPVYCLTYIGGQETKARQSSSAQRWSWKGHPREGDLQHNRYKVYEFKSAE